MSMKGMARRVTCPDCAVQGVCDEFLGDPRAVQSATEDPQFLIDAAYRNSPVLLIEIPHPVALARLADRAGFEGVDEVG